MRPYATSVCGLKLLVYGVLSYERMRPSATSACGLTLLVFAALSYLRHRAGRVRTLRQYLYS
jgi:hypothetical protein